MARTLATFVLLFAIFANPLAAQDEECRNPGDGNDLANLAITVSPSKRETFLAAVRDYGATNGMSVGGATDKYGWVVVLLRSRPWGVTIEVESMDASTFRALARTCNATQDWKPYWDQFKRFVETNRAAWRD